MGKPVKILLLFIALRLVVILVFTPYWPAELHTDFQFYYATARFSELGRYPLVNMWYEYGPLLAFLPQLAYWVASAVFPASAAAHYNMFAVLLGLALLAFDSGVLVYLQRIARRMWGIERANWLGWVYALLPLPLVFLLYAHHIVAAFFTLAAMDAFLQGKAGRSAALLGLGFTAKLLPVIVLAPVVRFLWPRWRAILGYTGIVFLVAGLVYLPLVLLGGSAWILASFRALGNVGSYATLWALLDGNWGPGYYGPLSTRLDLAQATRSWANPPVIPDPLVLLLFGLLYAWLFTRRLERLPALHFRSLVVADRLPPVGLADAYLARTFVGFVTLTHIVFHLWSKGWSPQWASTLLPLFLLVFPSRRGLALVLVFSALVTTHWAQAVPGVGQGLLVGLVLARSLLLVGVGWALWRWMTGVKRQFVTKKENENTKSK